MMKQEWGGVIIARFVRIICVIAMCFTCVCVPAYAVDNSVDDDAGLPYAWELVQNAATPSKRDLRVYATGDEPYEIPSYDSWEDNPILQDEELLAQIKQLNDEGNWSWRLLIEGATSVGHNAFNVYEADGGLSFDPVLEEGCEYYADSFHEWSMISGGTLVDDGENSVEPDPVEPDPAQPFGVIDDTWTWNYEDGVLTIGVFENDGSDGGSAVVPAEGDSGISVNLYRVKTPLETAGYSAEGITSIVFEEGITEIAGVGSTGLGAVNIVAVSIPASVSSIQSFAFSGCAFLATVEFAADSQLSFIGFHAFNNCSSLTSLDLSDTKLASLGDVDDGNGASVPFSGSGLTEILLPDTLKTIGHAAFNNCSGLRSILIPEGVTEVSLTAFNNCPSLEAIYLPNSLKSVSVGANSGVSANVSFVTHGLEDTLVSEIQSLVGQGVTVSNHELGDFELAYNEDGTLSVVRVCTENDGMSVAAEPAEAVEWLTEEYIPSLNGRLDDLSTQLESAEKKAEEAVALAASYQQQIESLEKQLETAGSSSNSAAIASLQNQLKVFEQQRVQLESQLEEVKAQLDASADELKQAKSELASALAQVATLQGQLEDAQDQSDADAEAIKQLQQQLADAQGKLTELQGQLDASASEASGLKTQLTEAQGQVAALQEQLKAAQGQSGTDAETIKQLQQQLAASQSALEQAPVVAQTIKVVNNKTVKASKKTGKLAKAKKLTMLKAKGKLTVTKVKGSAKLTVTKSGKIKVKKGTKKGTYKIRVKVKAAASGKYANAVTVVTLEVRVR